MRQMKRKPDYPKEAKWIATTPSGVIFWSDVLPEKSAHQEAWIVNGRTCKIGIDENQRIHWTLSLVQIID